MLYPYRHSIGRDALPLSVPAGRGFVYPAVWQRIFEDEEHLAAA